MRDNTDVVAGVKSELEARGVNLSGPCGAFEITKRVAWQLRDEGAGLLQKPSGNSCNGFSVDVVFYRDGTWVDCLINAETENKPAWQVGADKLDPARWAVPQNPDASAPPAPPAPAPVPTDSDDVIVIVESVHAAVNAITVLVAALSTLTAKLTDVQRSGVRLRL